MCGICGTVGFADRSQLEVMTSAIVHRGPNDGGVEIMTGSHGEPLAGLGNRRLSVIDLTAAGHQPMVGQDGTTWLTYNGEVFNFRALRDELATRGHRFRSRTDTEVVLRLYEDRGTDCVRALNGMFALAIWDGPARRLFLARDPFGIKPLYYVTLPGGRLAFASEVKSLIAGGLVDPRVDLESLHYFLSFNWVPGPKTLFAGVQKLAPGHALIWSGGTHRIERYAQIEPGPEGAGTEHELATQLRSTLEGAVERHLISDVPVGVFLSGGLDSSAILALGHATGHRRMKTYTITFRPEDSKNEQSADDEPFARMVARRFGAEHHEIRVAPDIVDLLPKITWALDEPVGDPAAITTYLICEAARDEATVLLSGQGADEVFGGYRVHLADRLSRPFGALPASLRQGVCLPIWGRLPALKDWVPGVAPGRVLALHRYFDRVMRGAALAPEERYVFHRAYYDAGSQRQLYRPDVASAVERFDPFETHLAYFREAPNASFVDRMLYVDQRTFLPELNLTYSDKASMASSLEIRVPFLDREVTDLMRRVPARLKVRRLTPKYLFRRAMQGLVPEEVIWRGKAGFGAPVRSWLRGALGPLVEELLSERTVRQRGYFEPQAIRRLIAEHSATTHDHTYRIWALLTLEMWHRVFVDGRHEASQSRQAPRAAAR